MIIRMKDMFLVMISPKPFLWVHKSWHSTKYSGGNSGVAWGTRQARIGHAHLVDKFERRAVLISGHYKSQERCEYAEVR